MGVIQDGGRPPRVPGGTVSGGRSRLHLSGGAGSSQGRPATLAASVGGVRGETALRRSTRSRPYGAVPKRVAGRTMHHAVRPAGGPGTPIFELSRWWASIQMHPGDWRSGSALRSHRRGHWFEPSIAHSTEGPFPLLAAGTGLFCARPPRRRLCQSLVKEFLYD